MLRVSRDKSTKKKYKELNDDEYICKLGWNFFGVGWLDAGPGMCDLEGGAVIPEVWFQEVAVYQKWKL